MTIWICMSGMDDEGSSVLCAWGERGGALAWMADYISSREWSAGARRREVESEHGWGAVEWRVGSSYWLVEPMVVKGWPGSTSPVFKPEAACASCGGTVLAMRLICEGCEEDHD